MPQNTYLNNDEKNKILKLYAEGKKVPEIGIITQRSRQVIKKFINCPSQYGKAISKAGRKSKLSERQKRSLIKSVRDDKKSLRRTSQQSSANVSHQTVWRLCNDSTLKYSKMLKAPTLTNAHKKFRLEFAKTVILKGENYWNKIIFSDEKRFCLDGPDGCRYYWHDNRKEKEVFSQNTFSKGVMLWGAISNTGDKYIRFIEGSINSKKYIKLLEETLLPKIDTNAVVFQQDNASSHKSKETMAWIHNQNLNLINWPAKSPDLNIIENIWGVMTKRLYGNKSNFANIAELQAAILVEWDNISTDLINTLYKSFPGRLLDVICKKGCFLA